MASPLRIDPELTFVPSAAAPGQFLAVRILGPAPCPLSPSETMLLQQMRPVEDQVWLVKHAGAAQPRWVIRLLPFGASPVEAYLVPASMLAQPPPEPPQPSSSPPLTPPTTPPRSQPSAYSSQPGSPPPWSDILAEYLGTPQPPSPSTLPAPDIGAAHGD